MCAVCCMVCSMHVRSVYGMMHRVGVVLYGTYIWLTVRGVRDVRCVGCIVHCSKDAYRSVRCGVSGAQ